jgi:hypothetical protein
MKVTAVIHTEIKLDLQPFGNFKFSWARKKSIKENVVMIRELNTYDHYNIGDENYDVLVKAMKKAKTEVFSNKVWSRYNFYTIGSKPNIIQIDHDTFHDYLKTL